jgi:hypothetical protein
MKSTVVFAIIAAVAIIASSAPAAAHHSSAMFDKSKTITVEGVVKKWELTNPHSWLWVEVVGKDGKPVMWGFEAEGPSTLSRAGIRPSDFKDGTKVKITGNPLKNGNPQAIWLEAVRESDKKKFDPRAGFAVK